MTVIDELAVLDPPVLLYVLEIRRAFLLPFLGRHGAQLPRIEVTHAMPTAQVLTIEERHEPGRTCRFGLEGDWNRVGYCQ